MKNVSHFIMDQVYKYKKTNDRNFHLELSKLAMEKLKMEAMESRGRFSQIEDLPDFTTCAGVKLNINHKLPPGFVAIVHTPSDYVLDWLDCNEDASN